MDASAACAVNTDRALRLIYEHTITLKGDEFFRALARSVASAMRVRYALVAEFANADTTIRTLAFWADNSFKENVEHALVSRPCEAVLSGDVLCYPQDVQTVFPRDTALAHLSAESCLAIPLIDASGHVLGHLAILDDAPMEVAESEMSALRNLGVRAAAELERERAECSLRESELRFRQRYEAELAARQRAEETLRKTEERLASVLGSAMDAIIMMDRQHRITLFNRAAEQVFLCSADHARGQRFDRFLSREFRRLLNEHLNTGGTVKKRAWAPEGVTAVRANGEEFPIEVTVSPVETAQECLYTIFLRDVNEREKAEQTLRKLQAEHLNWQEEISRRVGLGHIEIIGNSVEMRAISRSIEMVANTDATVLLSGETGTGKELIAKALHNASGRKDRMLIIVNCAALPSELIESELFGHEMGAFTGATAQRKGRFELADGGTIFLDEVGELTARAQAKLLRVLQERTFERVGGSKTIKIDARVIAATNRDLGKMVADGTFRDDLFYRLNVFPIRVPALRERKSDIPLLANVFLHRLSRKLGKRFEGISPNSIDRLMQYPWPGNIRELQNVMERAAIAAQEPMIEVADYLALHSQLDTSKTSPGSVTLRDMERRHIQHVLEQSGWIVEGKRGAAANLDLKPSTLRLRMHKLGIKRPQSDTPF